MEEKKEFEPVIESDLQDKLILAKIEAKAAEMYALAKEEGRPSDSLKLNYYDLEEIIDRHCYSKLAAAGHLGQVRRRLKKIRNMLEARSADLLRNFTDKAIEGSRVKKTRADGSVSTTTQVGLQKMDAKYRSSEYTRDEIYRRLQRKEEKLIEYVTIIEAIYECYQDKARFILGMQKTLNNEGNK